MALKFKFIFNKKKSEKWKNRESLFTLLRSSADLIFSAKIQMFYFKVNIWIFMPKIHNFFFQFCKLHIFSFHFQIFLAEITKLLRNLKIRKRLSWKIPNLRYFDDKIQCLWGLERHDSWQSRMAILWDDLPILPKLYGPHIQRPNKAFVFYGTLQSNW